MKYGREDFKRELPKVSKVWKLRNFVREVVWSLWMWILCYCVFSYLQTFGEPTRDAALYTAGDDAVILTRPRDFVVRKDETLPLDCLTCI